MIQDWQHGIAIGALSALLIWWVVHRIRRTFEDRCPQCGCLGQQVIYYMETGRSVGGLLHGRYYMTYKFLRCRRHPLHVRCATRDRYISGLALWLKKRFKPWQFRRGPMVEHLMMETGISCPTRIIANVRCVRHIRLQQSRLPEVHFEPKHIKKN